MTEVTSQSQRISDLIELFNAITYKQNATEVIRKLESTTIAKAIPDDIVILVHQLVEDNVPMPEIKSGISKLLNVMRKTLDSYAYTAPDKSSFFGICIANNIEALNRLNKIRPYIHQINKTEFTNDLKTKLISLWSEVQQISDYYLIKENIIFPLAEKFLNDYRCISVMWSIHDDIRRNINHLIQILAQDNPDLKQVNRLTGDLFFDINAIIFREEKLLYPFLEKNIPSDAIENILNESIETGFPYYNPQKRETLNPISNNIPAELIDLKSGQLTVEQIMLVFNHLPVDITYVDEFNKVRFFSTPKHRIFHRTNAVIGRDVHNCHPKESVHVVEKIVDSFRKGTKDIASFWINMRNGNRVLIQYFAVRDEKNEYKGVIEVTQIINEIQKLEGEMRILDWED